MLKTIINAKNKLISETEQNKAAKHSCWWFDSPTNGQFQFHQELFFALQFSFFSMGVELRLLNTLHRMKTM